MRYCPQSEGVMEANINLLDVIGKGPDAVRAFAAATPLAAADEDGFRIAVIRPAHPDWPNAAPEPGGPLAYTLKIGQPLSEMMFSLPNATYSAVRITATFPVLALEICADGRTTRTNIQELSRLLSPWAVKSEAEKQAAFSALRGAYEFPKPRPRREAFQSRRLGRIEPGDFDVTWSAEPIQVPLFDGQTIPVSLSSPGLTNAITPDDADAIDAVLDAFLMLGPSDRAAAGAPVLAYCKDTLEAIAADWPEARAMAAISDPADIWRHVFVREIDIKKDTRHGEPSIYVLVYCACDWEEEHGLQLVYRNGAALMRVSPEDGNVL
jgi:hypothetical protein